MLAPNCKYHKIILLNVLNYFPPLMLCGFVILTINLVQANNLLC